MYACAQLFCVLTNVSNKFLFRQFPLRGAIPPLRAPLFATQSKEIKFGDYYFIVLLKLFGCQIPLQHGNNYNH